MNGYRDAWELATSIIRWGALVLGGVCLLVNSALIGQFPEDLALGEGVALYFLSVGFLLAYALYWVGVTSIGLLMFRWLMPLLLKRVAKHSRSKTAAVLHTEFSVLWAPAIWMLAIATIVLGAVAVRPTPMVAFQFLLVAVWQGLLGSALWFARSRLQSRKSGLSLTSNRSEKRAEDPSSLRALAGFFVVWVLLPFCFVPGGVSFVDAAFRVAQLRKDHAVIHVRSPWDKRLTQAGMQAGESFLGADYARFGNVTVSLRSLGSRVVLELPAKSGKRQFISVPKTNIEVE